MPPTKPAYASDVSDRDWALLHRKPVGRIPDDARERLVNRLNVFAGGIKFHKHVREVTVRFRGGYAYVGAWQKEPPQQVVDSYKGTPYRGVWETEWKLCRLGWLGDDDRWLFHFWKYSDEKYEPSFLPSGACDGTPEEAFDCAGTVYFLT